MNFVAVVDPFTLEPQAVCAVDDLGTIEWCPGPIPTPEFTTPVEDRLIEGGIGSFLGADNLDAGRLAFASSELSSAAQAFFTLVKEWQSGAERVLPPVQFDPIFPSWPLRGPLQCARVTFARQAKVHLHCTDGPWEQFWPEEEMSSAIAMFAATAGDVLTVRVAPFERQGDVDLALAYGLAFAGDRELVVFLPRRLARRTLVRAAFLDTPIRIVTYQVRTVLGRWAFETEQAVLPARVEGLDWYSGPLSTAVHNLGQRAGWAAGLVQLANANECLRPSHRPGFLGWSCLGRVLLRIQLTDDAVKVEVGLHASANSEGHAQSTTIVLKGLPTPPQMVAIQAGLKQAVQLQEGKDDLGHQQRVLRARVADNLSQIGRQTEGAAAARPNFPDGKRSYIDFVGVDASESIHVVQTANGSDVMLVLDGLDHWIWAQSHAGQLASLFGLTTTHPRIVVDFVVGYTAMGPMIGPYTAAQAETLPGSMLWRCHVACGWESPDLSIDPLTSRTWPDEPRCTPPRHAFGLHAHLASEAHLPGPINFGGLLAGAASGIVPQARWALEQLAARGQLHRYVNHIRSSQAFALNLFGPLDRHDVCDLLGSWFGDVVEADPPVFEWTDPVDRLREPTPARPNRTQVDVMLRGRTSEGETVVALVEVKLAETDFGPCSAFQSRSNGSRSVCRQAGPFGENTVDCFQLRNRDGPQRRRYDLFLAPPGEAPPGGGCWYRGGLNQPMRNVALMQALLAAGDVDDAAYVLCAPLDNRMVHRTWRRAQALFGARLVTLDPEEVMKHHRHPGVAELGARYRIHVYPPLQVSTTDPGWWSAQLLELLSWQITEALIKRYPGRFVVILTHPGGGQYDCLAIYECRHPSFEQSVAINRVGSVHVFSGTAYDSIGVWSELIAGQTSTERVTEWIDARLGPPFNGEPATPSTHDFTIQVITCMAKLLGPTGDWTWRNGMLDSSLGSGVERDWFALFPLAQSRLRHSEPVDMSGEAAYRFWFLILNGSPALCIETTGTAYTLDDLEVDLVGSSPAAMAALLFDDIERHS